MNREPGATPPAPTGPRYEAPPPERVSAPFNVLDGLALVAWSVLAQVLVYIPFALAGLEIDTTVGVDDLAVLVVAQLVTFGGIIVYLSIRDRLSWDLFGRARLPKDLLIGLGVGAVGFGLVTIISVVLNALFGPLEPPDQALLETSTGGGLATTLSVIIAVVLAPIIEETVFRGVLFRAIRDRAGFWTGAVVSSIVFVAVHPEVLLSQPLLGTALFALGLLLAAAYDRTRSLTVVIVGHAVFNGITMALAIVTT